MKKLIVFLAAIVFSIGMYAQEGKIQAMPSKDHIMMLDGKMWAVKDGNTTAMNNDLILSDGTMVPVLWNSDP
ncbi:MAG: hypothetical protein QM710_13590 [Flavobacterium sp.]